MLGGGGDDNDGTRSDPTQSKIAHDSPAPHIAVFKWKPQLRTATLIFLGMNTNTQKLYNFNF